MEEATKAASCYVIYHFVGKLAVDNWTRSRGKACRRGPHRKRRGSLPAGRATVIRNHPPAGEEGEEKH